MKQYSQRLAAVLLGALAMAYQPLAAASMTLGFYSITNSNSGAVADGEANLSLEVIDLGGNQVQFTFTNNSTSSLADVYFDDGTLLGIFSITDSGSGVAFTQFASPANLPGGNLVSPAFQTSQGFSADSDSPTTKNGVSQGEWLTITFDLLGGKTYADTLAALALPNGGGTGDLRVGVHVQGFASGGGSESFINNPAPVPEAETWGMMLAGLGLVGWAVHQRRKQA
jgi:hypothetical protein